MTVQAVNPPGNYGAYGWKIKVRGIVSDGEGTGGYRPMNRSTVSPRNMSGIDYTQVSFFSNPEDTNPNTELRLFYVVGAKDCGDIGLKLVGRISEA